MFMHHIALVNGGHLLHMRVDHAEQEAEVQKGACLMCGGGPQALDQGKLWCIPPKSLSFIFKTLFRILIDCALSL
jgi:hypothetical protein